MEIANSQIVEFIVVSIVLGWVIGAVALILVRGTLYNFWKTSFVGLGGSVIAYCLINVLEIRIGSYFGLAFIAFLCSVLFIVVGERFQVSSKPPPSSGSSSSDSNDNVVNG
jgi:uncharacterized membrane protein YeaQ/YmgE (transglycosylase-associated protein family)